MNVQFTFERSDNLVEFAAISEEESRLSLAEACQVRKAAVESNAPRSSGLFAGSIDSAIEPEGGLIRGDVFSTDNQIKVAVIENGLAPGRFFNLSDLRDWADRKGIPVFLAARSITTRGIRARHGFERAADQTEAECDRILLDELPGRIATRL
jgi:hypothetical protein